MRVPTLALGLSRKWDRGRGRPADQTIVLGRLCFYDGLEHLDERVGACQDVDDDSGGAQGDGFRERRYRTVAQQKLCPPDPYR